MSAWCVAGLVIIFVGAVQLHWFMHVSLELRYLLGQSRISDRTCCTFRLSLKTVLVYIRPILKYLHLFTTVRYTVQYVSTDNWSILWLPAWGPVTQKSWKRNMFKSANQGQVKVDSLMASAHVRDMDTRMCVWLFSSHPILCSTPFSLVWRCWPDKFAW